MADAYGGKAALPPSVGGPQRPGASVMGTSPPRASGRRAPNVLWVMLDDLGVEQLECYDEVNLWDTPYTYTPQPTIARLAAQGVVFRRAYASSICSPTRALSLTGKLPIYTGISEQVKEGETASLLESEQTFYDLLEAARPGRWERRHFGKWHLSFGTAPGEYARVQGQAGVDRYQGQPINSGTVNDPDISGYGGTSVTLGGPANGTPGYWEEYDSDTGLTTDMSAEYMTEREAQTLINWLGQVADGQKPWVATWWMHAPHTPFHWAPSSLHSYGATPVMGALDAWRTAFESADTCLGRVLDSLPVSVRENTYVIVSGDNGSVGTIVDPAGGHVTPPPTGYDPEHFKNTAYESGVNVPLIIAGPRVLPGVCDSLVSHVDVFATICELAMGESWEDYVEAPDELSSRSMVPCLRVGSAYEPHAGEHTWHGTWKPTGSAITSAEMNTLNCAIHSPAHSYVLVIMQADATTDPEQELYHLDSDPDQQTPLNILEHGKVYRAARSWFISRFGLEIPDLTANPEALPSP